MSSIRKSLLQLTFSGACMRRWNDKLRSRELFELDKQGHKMIVAWVLTELNSRHLDETQRLSLFRDVIEGALFDYFYRLIITDIKPPVFYRIKEKKEQYKQLTEWVLNELRPVIQPLNEDFWQRCTAYHESSDRSSLADRILAASHYYASSWEFNLIRALNTFDDENEFIAQNFIDLLNKNKDVAGVSQLLDRQNALGRFASFCGQLRFQVRWSSTPRNPETSVLGHMFLVASFAYYFSLVNQACEARSINNFFCGLFHDLPELLTRDIISPVKSSVPAISEIIKACEKDALEERVFAPLRDSQYQFLVDRLSYYLGLSSGSEFDETIIKDGKIIKLNSYDELQSEYNHNEFDPKDGRMLKMCDNLTAFMEAHTSVRSGISSPHLYEAMARIKDALRYATIGNISIGTLLADFD